ncbi:hypothetical protein [Serratia sp. UGAL515B_01]|uniref:hypothetical protein n=1 Tax=Serratia sp. UGAL515B_01 TaxID=2986763 RepID=UPI0029557842|nr:hypothetical protein [Serratia sp. UGAL515B_01]WON79032.1 hypothetical protein OK023_05365 [Serratia sp. UGAL515B_01]
MHLKRLRSLSKAATGVIESGSLAIHAIGSGLALANLPAGRTEGASTRPNNEYSQHPET